MRSNVLSFSDRVRAIVPGAERSRVRFAHEARVLTVRAAEVELLRRLEDARARRGLVAVGYEPDTGRIVAVARAQ